MQKYLIYLKKSQIEYALELYANSESEAKILALDIADKDSQVINIENMRRPSKKNSIIGALLIFGSIIGMFLIKTNMFLFTLVTITMWTGMLIAQWKILRDSLNAILTILFAFYMPIVLFTTINDIPFDRFLNYFFY